MYICTYIYVCLSVYISVCLCVPPAALCITQTRTCNGLPSNSSNAAYMHEHIHTYTFGTSARDCCLYHAYADLQCAAIEFQPDDTSKTRLEQADKGKCRVQRRRDGAVKISSNPGTHVWLKVVDPSMYDVLPLHVRVVDSYLRYPSVCAAEGSACTNTKGSHICSCKNGYVGSGVYCVKEGASGSFLNGSKYQACPGMISSAMYAYTFMYVCVSEKERDRDSLI